MRNIAQQDEEQIDSVPGPSEDHHEDDIGMSVLRLVALI